MALHKPANLPLLGLSLLSVAMAQDTSTDLPNIIPTSSSTGMPQATDNAPGANSSSSINDNDNDSDSGNTSLVNYYFVFLALILCVAGLGVFLVWRRRKRAVSHFRNSRENALARDVSAWQGDTRGEGWHRRYWQGRLRSQEEVGRDEGLNELGEAPPAYAPPKTREDEEREAAEGQEPAVPLQTLSREEAGLKPPEYAEASVRPVEGAGRHSWASGSSSRPRDQGEHSDESAEPLRPQRAQ